MPFYADLHVHSKYSRATSRDCDLEHLALWAARKGIDVVATGDFTHPAWFEEIRQKLVPAEPGLFRLAPEIEREVAARLPGSCAVGKLPRFMLEVEISTIYKKGDRTRKIHHLIYAAELETAGRFREALGKIGNISSDGRPILGLDSRHLLEITLESGPDAYLIPAHVWTPWFAVLGSKSGFDSVTECYGDLSDHIFAVETGLSSDPPMNWRVSGLDRYTLVSNSDAHSPPMLGREACVFDTDLDYFAMRRALESGGGFAGTVEFFPEEGKYHMDGHRACGVRFEPEETRRHDGRCPACGKPLTVGVMHRVETLADRPEGHTPERVVPFRSLVPLPEIVSELKGVGPKSKTVRRTVEQLVSRLGPELDILERVPVEDAARGGEPLLAEALGRLRRGEVHCEAGYDGEYGVVKVFEPGELTERQASVTAPLFEIPDQTLQPASIESVPKPEARAATGGTSEAASSPSPTTDSSRSARQAILPTGSVLDGLDGDQRAAAEVAAGPLLIVAGPGSGKTRTLVYRLAHLVGERGVRADRCLAVTFTRRAASELEQRLDDLLPGGCRVRVTTFHGLGFSIVRDNAEALGFSNGRPRVADPAEAVDILSRALGVATAEALQTVQRLERVRLQGEEPDADTEDRLRKHLDELHRCGLVDYADLLEMPLRLFERAPDVAASYRTRFTHVSIDEYQDVDALQYRLVRHLAPADGNLCAIGDPDQSIYGFRGADVGFFLRFQEDYPSARTFRLERNYRSSRTIVAAALQVIAPSTLVEDRRLVATAATQAESSSASSSTPVPITLHSARSPEAEAEFVVKTMESLLGGTSMFSVDSGRAGYEEEQAALSFSDIAVLYRLNSQARALAEALERAGIPFQQRSHDRLLDRPEVRRLVRSLREMPAGDWKGTVTESLVAAAARLDAESPTEDEISAAIELLKPAAAKAEGDLGRFLAEIALGAEVDTWDPRAERVSLLTLHAAKGLEFPVVFIAGCEDGLVPYRREGEKEDVAEERRLFFVGLTRARSRLYLSHARRRFWRGEVRQRRPSPFLTNIEEALLHRSVSERRRGKRPAAEQLDLLDRS